MSRERNKQELRPITASAGQKNTPFSAIYIYIYKHKFGRNAIFLLREQSWEAKSCGCRASSDYRLPNKIPEIITKDLGQEHLVLCRIFPQLASENKSYLFKKFKPLPGLQKYLICKFTIVGYLSRRQYVVVSTATFWTRMTVLYSYFKLKGWISRS